MTRPQVPEHILTAAGQRRLVAFYDSRRAEIGQPTDEELTRSKDSANRMVVKRSHFKTEDWNSVLGPIPNGKNGTYVVKAALLEDMASVLEVPVDDVLAAAGVPSGVLA